MINFAGTPQRSGDWAYFKAFIVAKTLKVQFEEDDALYLIYGYDSPEVVCCTIWKGGVPSGGNQTQNDLDKTDFETNYKPYANRSIDDIPALIIASTIKTGGGSANMAVDGSVTPVVFEYNPPNNYDIEITALSLIFESTTAVAFGNKFVINTLNTLTNGLLLECRAYNQAFSWQIMRRTRDIVEIASDVELISGTTNLFRAQIHLPKSLRLSRGNTFAQADYLRLTVRDNLSTLAFAEGHFQGTKV